MSDGFYLKSEVHKNIKNEDIIKKDVLYFKFAKSGFDGKATRDHVNQYNHQFQVFLGEHPDFKLPDSFSEAEIGKPI